MMKAVIETGGKQYYVSKGDTIYVEKLDGNAQDSVVLDKVLMIDGEVGSPFIKGATVKAKILKQGKKKKIIVFKYKPKKKYRKKQGHRQPYTALEIMEITK